MSVTGIIVCEKRKPQRPADRPRGCFSIGSFAFHLCQAAFFAPVEYHWEYTPFAKSLLSLLQGQNSSIWKQPAERFAHEISATLWQGEAMPARVSRWRLCRLADDDSRGNVLAP
ncbi:hypothetical protein [Desulfovibrio sp. ZJ369]|uniref:hypothetical protein n=1 Tax=Desulfovibrio sp. ZJ369 TaxID=2709793 RepID=UPI0013ECDC0D|nr:hypothetical protein [Desulfovibrio sp. ZJ369]